MLGVCVCAKAQGAPFWSISAGVGRSSTLPARATSRSCFEGSAARRGRRCETCASTGGKISARASWLK